MDIESIANSVNPNSVALGAIVTTTIISIVRGWLVPRPFHVEQVKSKDAQIAAVSKERDDWKAAFETSEAARAVLTTQNGLLLESAKTTNHLIESLRNVVERINGREDRA